MIYCRMVEHSPFKQKQPRCAGKERQELPNTLALATRSEDLALVPVHLVGTALHLEVYVVQYTITENDTIYCSTT